MRPVRVVCTADSTFHGADLHCKKPPQCPSVLRMPCSVVRIVIFIENETQKNVTRSLVRPLSRKVPFLFCCESAFCYFSVFFFFSLFLLFLFSKKNAIKAANMRPGTDLDRTSSPKRMLWSSGSSLDRRAVQQSLRFSARCDSTSRSGAALIGPWRVSLRQQLHPLGGIVRHLKASISRAWSLAGTCLFFTTGRQLSFLRMTSAQKTFVRAKCHLWPIGDVHRSSDLELTRTKFNCPSITWQDLFPAPGRDEARQVETGAPERHGGHPGGCEPIKMDGRD